MALRKRDQIQLIYSFVNMQLKLQLIGLLDASATQLT